MSWTMADLRMATLDIAPYDASLRTKIYSLYQSIDDYNLGMGSTSRIRSAAGKLNRKELSQAISGAKYVNRDFLKLVKKLL